MRELTINWHITEACNFKCKYCFASWNKPNKKEILHNNEEVGRLLDQFSDLADYFQSEFSSIRLNLVGGEIFLYKEAVLNIIQQAKKRNIKLSAITNGSKLDFEINQIIANHLDVIGFSVDSLNELTNTELGRRSKIKPFDLEKMIKDIAMIRLLNPNIKIKLNTVVNKMNYLEDLSDLIDRVKPDKWKVFKVLSITHSALEINDDEFDIFIKKHQAFKDILYAENNQAMVESYLMIDPLGRFFQNSHQLNNYEYSEPINKVGIINAIKQIKFDIDKFKKRYR